MEKGYYNILTRDSDNPEKQSQSTIKMEKGYYCSSWVPAQVVLETSQSTIKMEKGYYTTYYKEQFVQEYRRNPQ